MRLEQLKRPPRHRDVAEAFGDDDRRAELLVPRHGHSQVVAEYFAEVLVIDSARHDRRRADRDRFVDGGSRHATTTDHDAAFQVGRDVSLRQVFVGTPSDQPQRPIGFASHTEDSLNECGLRFDDDALVGNDLDDATAQVREHLHGQRLTPKDDHPRHLRDRLDHPRDGRRHIGLKEPEEALRPRECLTRLNTLAEALHQRPQQISRRDSQPLGQVHRRGVSRHHRPRHDIARRHRLSKLNKHVPHNRQHAPPPPQAAARDRQSGCVCLSHEWGPLFLLVPRLF